MKNEPESWRFEDTYPRYEFAPLVKLVLATARWIHERRTNRAISPIVTGEHRSTDAASAPPSPLCARPSLLQIVGREPSSPFGTGIARTQRRHS